MKPLKAPTKHQVKSDATRRALLETAEVIFARDGFERAQIEEIARESGRTRGAVYAQFKTKEHLFFALLEQHIRISTEELRSLDEDKGEADHPARLAALRKRYSQPKNIRTAILELEMKLYALRHPESMPELRESYLRLYHAEEFAEYFGIQRAPGTSKVTSRAFALGALRSSLLLTMDFLPDQLGAKETTLLLTEVFDGLFPASPSVKTPTTRAKQSRVRSSI